MSLRYHLNIVALSSQIKKPQQGHTDLLWVGIRLVMATIVPLFKQTKKRKSNFFTIKELFHKYSIDITYANAYDFTRHKS